MKKIIYAVNSGCYSDYRIDALFSSKKLAKEFMSIFKDNDYNDIEDYELDPPAADLVHRGYSMWSVLMLRDGMVERTTCHEPAKYYTHEDHSIWRRTEADAYKGKGIPDALQSQVWAKTEKQAIKIVNEKRTEMIALGKF